MSSNLTFYNKRARYYEQGPGTQPSNQMESTHDPSAISVFQDRSTQKSRMTEMPKQQKQAARQQQQAKTVSKRHSRTKLGFDQIKGTFSPNSPKDSMANTSAAFWSTSKRAGRNLVSRQHNSQMKPEQTSISITQNGSIMRGGQTLRDTGTARLKLKPRSKLNEILTVEGKIDGHRLPMLSPSSNNKKHSQAQMRESQSPRIIGSRLKRTDQFQQPWEEFNKINNHDQLREMIQKYHQPRNSRAIEHMQSIAFYSSVDHQRNSVSPLYSATPTEYPGAPIHRLNKPTQHRQAIRDAEIKKNMTLRRNIQVLNVDSVPHSPTRGSVTKVHSAGASDKSPGSARREDYGIEKRESFVGSCKSPGKTTFATRDSFDDGLNSQESWLRFQNRKQSSPQKRAESIVSDVKPLIAITTDGQGVQKIQETQPVPGSRQMFKRMTLMKRNELEYELRQQELVEEEVKDIVQELHKKFSSEQLKAIEKKTETLQCPNSIYPMPSADKLRASCLESVALRKEKMYQELAKHSSEMEGMLSMTELRHKSISNKKATSAQEYVKNFSAAADSGGAMFQNKAGNAFAAMMRKSIVGTQAQADKKEIGKNIRKAELSQYDDEPQRTTFVSTFDKAKQRGSIYQMQEQINKQTLSDCVQNFEKGIEYAQRLKQRDIEYNPKQRKSSIMSQEEEPVDPRIKYMKRCLDTLELSLPILDKIFRKTLVLQDYHLSDGNCRGLADACEFLDHRIVNRMLFNNCGLTGDTLSIILEGIAKMKDFKALVYVKQPLNALAISKMMPLIENPIPYHLEELTLVDTKMGATLIEQLMDGLIEGLNRLKKFTLVNVNHSDLSFQKVVEFVEDSTFLKELDLSWSGVRPQNMLKLLQVIEQNRMLTSLSLSYNYLLEDQPVTLTDAQIAAGELEVKLSKFNMQVMTCFKDFIKYNLHLAHINLERCGLIAPALKYIAALLRKSQALRCLHLCNNEGLSQETITWIRQRIHAKPEEEDRLVKQFRADKKQDYKETKKAGPLNKRRMMKVHRGASIELQSQSSKQQEWRDLREGLKLRNIVQSRRANDFNNNMCTGVHFSKCIIQRQLGHKHIMPGSAQWGVYTGYGPRDECWICGHYILTVFVWTPRIGQLARERDLAINKHYMEQNEELYHTWPIKPGHHDGYPYILGPFTNWAPIRMHNAIEYTQKNDPVQPDFEADCVMEGTLRATSAGKDTRKTEEEKDAVLKKMHDYYFENWHRALLKLVHYKNPGVANSDQYSLLTLKADKNQPIFFHVDFLKPGKTTYVVEHKKASENKNANDQFFDMTAFDSGSAGGDESSRSTLQKLRKPRRNPPDVYVHNTLTQFRQEDIIHYYNPRHYRETQTDVKQVKHVFEDFRKIEEIIEKLVQHDWDRMNINRVVPDFEQLKKIKAEVTVNCQMLTEIYMYLRGKSKNYPFLDPKDVHRFFIDKLDFSDFTQLHKATLYNICLETSVQGERLKGEPSNMQRLLRHQFIEVLIRMSLWLFTQEDLKDQFAHITGFVELTPNRCWFLFLKHKIKPMYEREQIPMRDFRENELWQHDIEMVYTLNESGLRVLFKKYSQPGGKAMLFEDLQKMIADSKLKMSRLQLIEAFGCSKQTIVKETDSKSFDNYYQLNYTEFQEMLSRLAMIFFRDSEMHEEPLQWKLEYILQQILAILQLKVHFNKIIIEEFSDSDEDY